MRTPNPVKLAFLIWALAVTSPLQASEPNEGFEFVRITPPVPTQTGDKVEVLELFWYGCPHCWHLEPAIEHWLEGMPEQAEFRRMPAILNAQWALHARAYYTAEALGVLDRMHPVIFRAIHEQKNPLKDEDSLAKLFAQHGVAEEEFRRTFNSFFVDAQVRRAQDLSKRYDLDGVPAIVVDGTYRSSATLAGGQKELFEVVDHLIVVETEIPKVAEPAQPSEAEVK